MNPETILGTTFAALLNSLWQSAAMALLVWAALRFLPRAHVNINAATRCAVWWAVLAAVVFLPLAPQQAARLEAPAPYVEWAPVQAPIAAAPVDLTPIEIPAASATSSARGPLQITAGAGLIAIFAIWALLSLFRTAQLIRSYRYLRGIKQRSRGVSPEQLLNFNYWLLACRVGRSARLLVSSEIVSPMAVGFRRPAVIVPETLLNEFSADELDHVILHELAHIARYDDWTNLFARLIGAVLPIHPVAVWLIRNIEQEREIACDDWVVAMTGQARPYAASLTRLFELCSARRRQLLATGMAGRASHLGERIEALLRAGRDFTPRVSLLRVALGAAILLGLVVAGAQAPRWVAFAQEPPVAPAPPRAPLPAQAPVPPVAPLAPTPPQPRLAPELLGELAPEFEARQLELQKALEQLQEMQEQFADQNRRYDGAHPEMRRLADEMRAQEVQVRAREGEIRSTLAQLLAQQAPNRPERATRGPRDSFLAALVAAGYGNLSVDEIIELREHGVSGDFLRALGDAGMGKLPAKDLVALANNGVRPDLIRALRQAFPEINVRDIIAAAQQGVRPDDLREAKEFSPTLTLPQIIRLKQAGVI